MHVIVSPGPGVPLYEQIVEQIRQQIMAGELTAGTPLPSLRALAGELRVSLITTTRAYNDLAAEGLIVNVPGKGSFVAQIDATGLKRGLIETIVSLSRAEHKRRVQRTLAVVKSRGQDFIGGSHSMRI